jgi:two-component system sensor histidine kinase KdpD
MVSGIGDVSKTAARYIQKYFNLECAIFLKNELGQFDREVRNEAKFELSENEMSIAAWVCKNSVKAGKYTQTLPSTDYTFYPMAGNNDTMGVIAVKHTGVFTQGEEQFWDAFLSQISGKYEREFLRHDASKAFMLAESDKLYKTLFNSISHELRIPVTTVIGATDMLLSRRYPEETKEKLYSEINTAALRLNRLIENLLNMSRLESGRITPHPDWCDVHDLANSVAGILAQELQPFTLSVVIPHGMPLVYIDFGLVEQILYNLVLNATQYAPAGTGIRLKFYYDGGTLQIQVMDRGRGFATSELSSVFNKFYRGQNSASGGTGLGLSIVKGFAEAHRGTVTVANRKNGGAIFTVKIPVDVSGIDQLPKHED